jgi:hypothetical protein
MVDEDCEGILMENALFANTSSSTMKNFFAPVTPHATSTDAR